MFRFYNQFIASCDHSTDVIDLYVSCFLYVPLTDFHSIYFIIVNSDAPIIARATQNGDPRAICRLPQKVASLEPPISNMDTHIYTHLYDIQRSFSYMYNCASVLTSICRPHGQRERVAHQRRRRVKIFWGASAYKPSEA